MAKKLAVNPELAGLRDMSFTEECSGKKEVPSDMKETVDDTAIISEVEKDIADNELVTLTIPVGEFDGVDDYEGKAVKFNINFKDYFIPLGKPTVVPKFVADYYHKYKNQLWLTEQTRRKLSNERVKDE